MQAIIYTGGKPTIELADVFRNTMEELILNDPRVVYIDADLMGSMKTHALWRKYRNNVINTGIQEANMIGVAAGLYLAQMKPYVHSFSPFATRRVFDQVFVSVGYAKKSVRIIGSDAGIMATYNGGTHMCFEDIAMMRTIPGACIIDVTDGRMFSFFLKETKDRPGVTYFRTPRRDAPDIYPDDVIFQEGKGKILHEGDDVTIIASGIMVSESIKATELLENSGIHARLIDIVTIKPIDEALLIESAGKTKAVVTAENHNILGGLGGAVSEVLSANLPVPIIRVGIQDEYGQTGNEQYLRSVYALTADDIVLSAKKAVAMKKEIAELNCSK